MNRNSKWINRRPTHLQPEGPDVWKISRPRDISSDLEAISRPRDISRSPAISSNLKQSRSTETQLQNQGNSLLWRQAQFTYRQKAAITESLAHGELLFWNLARAKCLLYTHQSLFRTVHTSGTVSNPLAPGVMITCFMFTVKMKFPSIVFGTQQFITCLFLFVSLSGALYTLADQLDWSAFSSLKIKIYLSRKSGEGVEFSVFCFLLLL